MHTYIDNLLAENTKLTKEKADALQDVAKIQKENAATTAKYKGCHARLILADKSRLGLDQSLHKRIVEKHEVIAINESLTTKNAELLQIHADLSYESASLKSENAEMVSVIQQRDNFITQLQAEVASLKATQTQDQEQHEAIKAERDRLQMQVEVLYQTERKDTRHGRGRSSSRSRSPWSSRSPEYHDSRYRRRSRGRPDILGQEYRGYEQYVPRYDDRMTSPRRNEVSHSPLRGSGRPAPCETAKPPTPRHTPDALLTASSGSPNRPEMSGVPTAPKAFESFSLRLPKNTSRRSKRGRK